jgi:hypothetical protein
MSQFLPVSQPAGHLLNAQLSLLTGKIEAGAAFIVFFVDCGFAEMQSSALELQILRESASST